MSIEKKKIFYVPGFCNNTSLFLTIEIVEQYQLAFETLIT